MPLRVINGGDGISKNTNGYVVFGGESKAQFKARVISFMKKLEVSGYENVAVFSHAGVLRSAFDFVVSTELERKTFVVKIVLSEYLNITATNGSCIAG